MLVEARQVATSDESRVKGQVRALRETPSGAHGRVPGSSGTRLLVRSGPRQQPRPSRFPPCLSAFSLSVYDAPGSEHVRSCSVILGRAIKNEYLALGTIFGAVGLSMLATSSGKNEAPAAKPTLEQVKDTVKIGASSKCVPYESLYS